MAYIDKQAYATMIDALGTFAQNLYEQAEELYQIGSTAASGLGDEDPAAGATGKKTMESAAAYGEACKVAGEIANAMADELERAMKEEDLYSDI